MPRIAVIGSGFSGLSAACFLAKEGYDVTVLEKNDSPGSRARKFSTEGFTSVPYQSYSEAYWDKRVLSPSCLLFYLGVNKKLKGLLHHSLFFDQPFDKHAEEIYDSPRWPTSPQFYVCCTSKSDSKVAPAGCENVFVLIPVAPGLKDDENIREKYFNTILDRFENILGENISNHIVYKRSYAHSDFISDYNAFKGNAYGLANTLWQSANLRPSIVSKKVENLFYTGHLTVPGPGVPPALISGEVVAKELI